MPFAVRVAVIRPVKLILAAKLTREAFWLFGMTTIFAISGGKSSMDCVECSHMPMTYQVLLATEPFITNGVKTVIHTAGRACIATFLRF